MRPRVLLAAAGLLSLIVLGFSSAPRTVLTVDAPDTEADVEWFGGTRQVEQSFVSPTNGLSAVTVSLRRPVPTDGYPILARVREDRENAETVRTVTLKRADIGDDGALRVRFPPIRSSAGRAFVITFEAPDAHTRFLLLREIDSSRYETGVLLVNGRERPGVLGFVLEAYERRAVSVWRTTFSPFALALRSYPPLSGALAFGAAVGLVVLATPRLQRRRPRLARRQIATALTLLAVVHFLLHLPFLQQYPGTNDEGAYLMDIDNLRAGHVPFRDTLAKGPFFLLALSPVVFGFPGSLLAARLFMSVLSSLTVPLLYLLGRNLGGVGVGWLASLLWAVSPVVLGQTTYVLLQGVSVPLVTSALVLLTQPSSRRNRRLAAWAGIILAAAYLARASSVAFAPIAVLLPFLRDLSWRRRIGDAARIALGFAGTLAVVAVLAVPVLGPVRSTIFFNLEAWLIGQAREVSGGGIVLLWPPGELLERLLAFGAALFRSGAPLALLWLALLLRRAGSLMRLPPPVPASALPVIAAPFLRELAQRGYFIHGGDGRAPAIQFLMAVTVLVTALLLFLRPRSNPRVAARDLLLLGGGWLSLAVLYANFGRFRQHYHAEFLPLYVLGAALFISEVLSWTAQPLTATRSFFRVLPAALLAALLAVQTVLAYPLTLTHPHTGTIPLLTARRVADILAEHSAPGDEILTAQGLFTFLARRALPFGASHPGWYLEERTGVIPTWLRRVYLPDYDEIRRTLTEQNVRLVVTDRRTNEVYLQGDPELKRLLHERYVPLATVRNPLEEEPVIVWRRRD